ncbi:hypothetical protein OHB26_19885 [Nocardia sp. NBC_01503]|uniref:GAP1-M domain-containing protein n=1 Tax=Nocardia sp. NBC_01503 TaxID=2975997 RepID=UPI002E7BE1CC|nr:hypothetical protein [Nocardia sp. NBC_01503]WTL29277.1 hypothetical protein OHB26_19885 [Nocardia sp. NBC_01503]
MTGFPQLVCGWALVNLESSGAGVGVVARSWNWPAVLGFTVRELGSLVTLPEGGDPIGFALEFTVTRGLAVAGLKTPSQVRPGTCVTHLIAGDTARLDGAIALRLFASGGFLTSLNGSVSPTDHWETTVPDSASHGFDATAEIAVEQPWLPALIGAALAHLAGQGPTIVLQVEDAHDAVRMLTALYGMLPRNVLRELTFSTTVSPLAEMPSITTVIGDATPPDRRVITTGSGIDNISDTYQRLGRDIVEHRRAGITLPSTLSSVNDIRQWCYQQHLRTLEPAVLDDAQMVQVLTDPTLTPDWFTDATVARRAIHLALDRPEVTTALANLQVRSEVRAAFEQTLTDCVMTDRDRGRATRVAQALRFDLSEVVVASAFRRLDNGTLSVSDAKTVWPQLQQDWAVGDTDQRKLIIERLQQHRALREFTIDSQDRYLVYETVRAEISDPAVHTGSSRLLRTAMYSQLPIVAQLMVNISCTSRDRYILEQILACAPADRLPTLVAECTRYPAVDAFELMKAVTIVRAEPAELVEGLKPAWTALRRAVGVPQAIEKLMVLDAEAAQPEGQSGRSRLRQNMFGRKGNRGNWSRSEVSALLRAAADDPPVIEEHFEMLRAAIDSDVEFVAGCMAERSADSNGATVLTRIMLCAAHERVPALLTACAQQRDLDPYALLRAVAELDLESSALVELLAGGWPHLRTRLDLPRRIATLVALDAAAALPARLKPLSPPKKQRRNSFWR